MTGFTRRVFVASVLSLSLAACGRMGLPVAGVASDRPWDHLPVQAWITHPELQVISLSACLAACDPPAFVGALSFTGEAKRDMLALLAAPDAIARFLHEKDARDINPKRKAIRIRAFGEKLAGERPGFLFFMAREDGSRPVYTAVFSGATKPDDGSLHVVFAIASSREGALWQAQAAAKALP